MSKPKRPLRFEYGKRDNGQFYWHIKSGNGEILAQGEGYKRRAGVLKVYHALFDIDKPAPTITDLNAGDKRKPRWVVSKIKPTRKCTPAYTIRWKKPAHYSGKLNRSWP